MPHIQLLEAAHIVGDSNLTRAIFGDIVSGSGFFVGMT